MTWHLHRFWRFAADMWNIYRMPADHQLDTRHGYARLRWAWLWALYGWQLSTEARTRGEPDEEGVVEHVR